mgnify:FL=1
MFLNTIAYVAISKHVIHDLDENEIMSCLFSQSQFQNAQNSRNHGSMEFTNSLMEDACIYVQCPFT